MQKILKKRLNRISNIWRRAKRKGKELIELSENLKSQADEISDHRKRIKTEIEREIIDELNFLGFSHPVLK